MKGNTMKVKGLSILLLACVLLGCGKQQVPVAEQQIEVEEAKESSAIDIVNMNHYYFTSLNGVDFTRYRYEYPKPAEGENVYMVASETKVDVSVLVACTEKLTGWQMGFMASETTKEGIKVKISDTSDIYQTKHYGKGEYAIDDQKTLIKVILGSLQKIVQSEAELEDGIKNMPVYFVDEDGKPLVIEGIYEADAEEPYSEAW